MLSPVSSLSTASTSLGQRDMPAVAQQALTTLVSTPDAAVALSLAANSEVEGKLNMLLIGARERMIDSLFAVVDAVSQSLAMQPEAGESNVGYALRLAAAVNNLPASQVAAVQQQLNAQGQTAPLALVARALQNPAGNEAAQVVAYMEVVRYKEKDLATKAVVASYGQNGGAEEPEAETAPRVSATALAQAGSSAPGSATGQSKLPAVAGSTVPTASTLPSAAEEPAEPATAEKPAVSVPLPLTNAPSQQTAAAPAKMPSPTTSGDTPAPAASSADEMPMQEATNTPQSVAPSLPTGISKQAVATQAMILPAPGDEQAPALARSEVAANPNPQESSRSAANPSVATSTAIVSPRASQALPESPAVFSPTNATIAPQPQATGYQPAAAALQAFIETVELPPIVIVAGEEAQSIQQQIPGEEAVASPSPQPQQPQNTPVNEPLRSVVNGPVKQDIQAVLKVVVDRLAGATGVELLQTMAEVETVAEKVVAQALVADMLDSAELGSLPSPDDAALPTRNAQVQQSVATVVESPVEELASLVALNRMLAEGAPVVQAMVQQQPMQPPLPLGVPFAIGQYLRAEDDVEENEPLHIDRVDAVGDEEDEEAGAGQERGTGEEAADEQPEDDYSLLVADEVSDAEVIAPEASEPVASRPLALPQPAPMEPLRATAFNLYQRMGSWD